MTCQSNTFHSAIFLEYIDWEGGQNSNHKVVGFPTGGWISNHWLEIHPWWVNFQPFILVGLDAVVNQCLLSKLQMLPIYIHTLQCKYYKYYIKCPYEIQVSLTIFFSVEQDNFME